MIKKYLKKQRTCVDEYGLVGITKEVFSSWMDSSRFEEKELPNISMKVFNIFFLRV